MNRTPLLLALLSIACAERPTAVVEPGPIAPRTIARAVVEPRDGIAHVSAPVIARITSIEVEVGDRVARGDELATYDTESLVGPEPLLAPIAGVVIARRASVGDDVSRADGALFEIADSSSIRVRFELEGDPPVSIGARAEVVALDGAPIAESRVARLSPRVEPRTLGGHAASDGAHLVRAGWIDLDPIEGLALGREVEVRIDLHAHEAVARAPRDAITVHDGRAVVWTPGTFGDDPVEVRLGASDDAYVEIEGVAPGTRVRLR